MKSQKIISEIFGGFLCLTIPCSCRSRKQFLLKFKGRKACKRHNHHLFFAISSLSTLELGGKSCNNFKSIAQHRPIFLLGFCGQDPYLCLCVDGTHGEVGGQQRGNVKLTCNSSSWLFAEEWGGAAVAAHVQGGFWAQYPRGEGRLASPAFPVPGWGAGMAHPA